MKTSFTTAQLQTTTRANSATPAYLRAFLLGGLAIIGSISSAFAQEGPSVKAKQADAQALYLTIENPAQQRMHIQVVSLPKCTNLINEANHKASYGLQLNFNGVPAGPYAVLLSVGREHYRYNVQVTAQPQTAISVRELAPAQTPEVVASATR